jgi:hypothetical protein
MLFRSPTDRRWAVWFSMRQRHNKQAVQAAWPLRAERNWLGGTDLTITSSVYMDR